MTAHNLKDYTVLVTRPEQAGIELCNIIEQNDGKAIHFPTIAFAPRVFSLPNLQTIDLLIFISPQAVIASAKLLQEHWPKENAPKIAAVGEGTKKVLLEKGFAVNFVPEAEWGSEGLLQLPALKAVKGRHILIVRGEGGRELLADTLSARGATVSHLLAYERVMPQIPIAEILSLMKINGIHAIVCTSFTGVQNLKKMLTEDAWPYIKTMPLVVVSDRIKALAQDLGFSNVQLATNASHDAILQTLIRIRNESCQTKQQI